MKVKEQHFDCCSSSFNYFNVVPLLDPVSGVKLSLRTVSAVERGFKLQMGQTKDHKIGIFCFHAKHAVLRRKSNDWLARNQDNVSEWSDISTHGLLFQ